MMKTLSALFFMLLLAYADTLLAGEVMKLTENDAGKTVELRVGDELEILLPGNPATGYAWEVSSLDSSVLKPDKSEYLHGNQAIGSGGMEVIRLHAICEGSGELKLIYHRPFERNKPPLKTLAVNILIKK